MNFSEVFILDVSFCHKWPWHSFPPTPHLACTLFCTSLADCLLLWMVDHTFTLHLPSCHAHIYCAPYSHYKSQCVLQVVHIDLSITTASKNGLRAWYLMLSQPICHSFCTLGGILSHSSFKPYLELTSLHLCHISLSLSPSFRVLLTMTNYYYYYATFSLFFSFLNPQLGLVVPLKVFNPQFGC